MSGLEGICPKCGARYYGWALTNPVEQKCEQCGISLEISRDGVPIKTHYSPFTAPEYKIASNKTGEDIITAS
jgi:hypothetical protein